ncbi:MAG: MBL fold metallo-hydrolase [Planctomycetes bacterium]|nr:MBL fold metallo-hydrolase [Planctomycetota bacterium]
MSTTVSFRDSSAVLMVRGQGVDTQVYLVRRSDSLRFFGGYWALPGGVLDAGDGDLKRDAQEAFRWCAARELFEETGVLLDEVKTDWTLVQRADNRQGLIESPDLEAWKSVRGKGAALDSLAHLGLLRTPAFAPVRYSTHFYGLEFPGGDEPNILPGELSHGEFIRPAEALEQWRKGERLIVPPVRTLLEFLAKSLMFDGGWDDFLEQTPDRLRSFLDGELPPILNSPGIYMLPLRTPTLPPATTTNTYLVGQEHFFVVDPGTPHEEDQEALIEFIRKHTSDGAQLHGILLTHHHEDHVGGLRCLQEAFDVPVLGHIDTLSRLMAPGSKCVLLEDGQELALGDAPDGSPDWCLQAIHTPGHASGHMVFRDTRYGAVLGGDMASTVSTIVIDPPEGHLRTYLNSLQLVHDLGPGLFYPAHGPVARDGQALMRKYLAHRADRERQLAEALAANPESSPEQLVPVVYTELPLEMYSLAVGSLLAGLIKLKEDGRARCEQGLWSLLESAELS